MPAQQAVASLWILDLSGGFLLGGPYRITSDLSPTMTGAEVRKYDILNVLDSRRTHSTMRYATVVPCLPGLCHQYGDEIWHPNCARL